VFGSSILDRTPGHFPDRCNLQELRMKLLLPIVGWLVGIVAALVVALALSVVVDAAQDGRRLEGLTDTQIGDVRAFVAKPAGDGPFPAVVMVHEFWGLRQEIVDKAKLLAEDGYVVVAPDTYRNQRTDWIPRAIFLSASMPKDRVNMDMEAVFAWLETQANVDPKRIAVMGFCYGGTVALNFSLSNPRVAATGVFYGQLQTDPEILKRLPGPVLGVFGGADVSIPLEKVRAFEAGLLAANIPHEVKIYDGMGHAFVQSVAEIEAGGPQGQAWAQLKAFLNRSLQNRVGSSLEPQLEPLELTAYANPMPVNVFTMLQASWLHRHH
jgi:carboxymethylenebutenolidase